MQSNLLRYSFKGGGWGGDEENKLYCRLRLAWWIVPHGASPLTMTNYINFIFSWKKWKKNISYFQIFLQKMKNYFGFAFYLKLICAVIPTQKKTKNHKTNKETDRQTNKQINNWPLKVWRKHAARPCFAVRNGGIIEKNHCRKFSVNIRYLRYLEFGT